MADLLDLDLLDEEDPFEIDEQAAHLFKHASLGIDDVYDVWRSDPPPLPRQATGALAHGERSGRESPGCTNRADRLRRDYEVSADRLLRRC